jgi:hypothetical protein
MDIQGSILEALGVNLYSSIGKCLVEFAANAYDSDSPGIEITIPFNQIAEAREKVRKDYKAKANPQSKVRVILDPLPEHIKIVIKDKGHGMSPENIQDKFLPLNRNRRLNNGMQPEPTLNMPAS